MSFEQYYLDKYGPVINLEVAAKILGRSPQGLRVCLYRDNEVSRVLNSSKVKIGRRIYFKTLDFMEVFSLTKNI